MNEAEIPAGIGPMLEAMCAICLEEGVSHRQLAQALRETFLKVYRMRLDLLMETPPVPAPELEQAP